MLFVRNESFKEYIRRYPVTSLIALVHVVLFILMEIKGSSVNTKTLLDFGALYSVPGYLPPEWWRFFTAMFLHIGLSHLLFNTFALIIFAPPLERMLGSARYAAFYIISGALGSAISFMLHTDKYVAAGASGAIYGLYAAYLYLSIFRRQFLDQGTRQTIVIILVSGLLFSLIVPNVDLYTHLGGFAVGFVLFALIVEILKRKDRR
ncbi:rhomboid family intramembrane serine protease [Paenibacillus lutrae]|uniref:Rhomboid family intramembrane serine protease n=1 Tax=Paenibacillus lutrae TaxID=2078573 RepID=A0A7X3FMK7_9BACL|nr:rhomboid family intramembrane serine protease [Paenibacillus lutrae]MVP02495.1 rhomboid family intramembrane serine protease [Paenibacillus lutrae]